MTATDLNARARDGPPKRRGRPGASNAETAGNPPGQDSTSAQSVVRSATSDKGRLTADKGSLTALAALAGAGVT